VQTTPKSFSLNEGPGKPRAPAKPPLPARPRDLFDHALGYADAAADRLLARRPGYETVAWEDLLATLEARFGGVDAVLREPPLLELEARTRRLLAGMRGRDPFTPRWAADSLLARLCYLACRLLRPAVVVETGVAYGVSSAFVLAALERNGRGVLHSVDLPPLRRGTARAWGAAVPAGLEGRWRVHRGTGGRVLPGLLEELGAADLFLHDSLHTRRNMRREFEAVWPRLRPGGVLLADDVERNGAFGELRSKKPALWCVVRDRERAPLHGRRSPVVFGLAVK
jgi:predicted O-methyltransferase YrrM